MTNQSKRAPALMANNATNTAYASFVSAVRTAVKNKNATDRSTFQASKTGMLLLAYATRNDGFVWLEWLKETLAGFPADQKSTARWALSYAYRALVGNEHGKPITGLKGAASLEDVTKALDKAEVTSRNTLQKRYAAPKNETGGKAKAKEPAPEPITPEKVVQWLMAQSETIRAQFDAAYAKAKADKVAKGSIPNIAKPPMPPKAA